MNINCLLDSTRLFVFKFRDWKEGFLGGEEEESEDEENTFQWQR